MELKQLYYYMAVAELLSFSRAAERLYISQPALSQRITELEKELDVQLLIRNRRKVELTEAGKTMLNICRDLTNRIEGIPALLKHAELTETKSDAIRVGLTKDACKVEWFQQCLSQAIKELKQIFPLVTVKIQEVDYTAITPECLAADFELCIAMYHSTQSPCKALNSAVLYTDHLCLLISREHPNDVPGSTCRSLLENTDLFLIDHNDGMHYQMSRILAELKVTPHIRYLNSENMSMLHVLSGEGAIIYPRRAVQQHKTSSNLDIYDIDIESDAGDLYYMAYWNEANTNGLIQVFCKILHQICGEAQDGVRPLKPPLL